MSTLTVMEKRKLERILEMRSGYVLNFSNGTMEDFFADSVAIEIYEEKYNKNSGSKAHRMRAFWEKENDYTVGKLLSDIFENWQELKGHNEQSPEELHKIALRLKDGALVPELDSIESVLRL